MAEIIAKIPIQDTRLFYKKWDNFENLNNLLKTEIEAKEKKIQKDYQLLILDAGVA